MGFREMRGGDGVSDVEIRRNEIIELLYTNGCVRVTISPTLHRLGTRKSITSSCQKKITQ